MTRAARIVVTGIGLWTALGRGRETNFARLAAGDTGFSPARILELPGLAGRLVAEIDEERDLAEGETFPAGPTRAARFAARTIAEALAQAGLDPRKQPHEIELLASVSTGGMFETEQLLTRLWRGAVATEADLAALVDHPISAAVDFAQRTLGPFARVATVCSACSGGALALGLGLSRLRLGRARFVVAGGVDSSSRLTVAGFGSLQSLDPDGCRPFAASRKGLVLGEGAAFLVLEREDTAVARGAAVLGYLGGYAVRSEAHHITHPEPAGTTPAEVIRRALVDAGVTGEQVGYVSAHGTGTPLNDAMEAKAMALAFGERAREIPISSQKGQVGHTLAAAGAVEAAATLLALGAGVVLPNVDVLEGPMDPAFDLALVGRTARPASVDVAISSSFGFGGTDAVVVLSRTPTGANEATVARPIAVRAAHVFDRGLEASLDASRVRRFDVVSRAYAAVVEALLVDVPPQEKAEIGLLAGSAYGSTEAAAAFFSRVEEKGARFASPADFPNLVPSSAGANAAIYTGLEGPSATVAALDLSFFAVLETASDLLADGRAQAMVGAHVEVRSRVVEDALARACGTAGEGTRGEGGAALLLERRDEPVGEAILRRATLGFLLAAGVRAVDEVAACGHAMVPGPVSDARVVIVGDEARGQAAAALLGWGAVPALILPAEDVHEARAATATARALAHLARRETARVLVVQAARDDVGFAVLAAP